MNTHAAIEPAAQLIPLSQLYLHDMNPRQNGSAEDTEAMAASIAVNGLIQNLAGYADPDRPGEIGIVAGGRRLRALQHLAKHGSGTFDGPARLTEIPVRVTNDPMIARAWAGAEAATQKPLHPADEIRAYAAMAEQGNSPDMIARAFAQTEAHVRRRLALADLIPEALEALRAGHIPLDVAKALTLARNAADQLSVLTTARAGNWNAARVRQALTPDTVRSDDRRVRFIGTELYLAEGGTMQTDLFEEFTYLEDAALVERLFARELAAQAEALRAEQGWQWVRTTPESWSDYRLTEGLERLCRPQIELPEGDARRLEDLSDFDRTLTGAETAELEALHARMEGDFSSEQRETGGILVLVNRKGEVEIEDAYREKDRARQSGSGSAEGGQKTVKPDLTAAGADDLCRIGLLALQTALADKPDLVLDIFAWQLERGRPAWDSPFAIQLSDQKIAPEAEGSARIDARLAETSNEPRFGQGAEDPVEAFTAFLTEGKKHRNAVITRHLVRTLQRPAGGMAPFGALLADFCGASVRKVWTPDAASYFNRLPTGALELLWVELLNLDAGGPERMEFGKLKKGEKAKQLERLFSDAGAQEALGLSRAQIAAIDAWLPPELRVAEG